MTRSTAPQRRARTRPVTLTATLAVAVLGLSLLTTGVAHADPPTAPEPSTDTTALPLLTRAQVWDAHLSSWLPLAKVQPEWTGSYPSCTAGTVAALFQDGMASGLSYVRRLAGLAPVTINPTLSTQAQQAALMMGANSALDHTPPTTWDCWTADGATAAARSNLALFTAPASPLEVIEQYLDDSGAGA